MRQIVLDTETTGLEPAQGHRIIEIGCVEIFNRRLTGNHFHFYINPERKIDKEAEAVHGINAAFLADKPKFADVATAFFEFIKGAQLVIHNAPFDIGFINHEFKLLDNTLQDIKNYCSVIDTLPLARQMHPGQKNSLDALCKRYSIDNSKRDLHGALMDASLLAHVYLAMTGGQASFFDTTEISPVIAANSSAVEKIQHKHLLTPIIQASQEELLAHQAYLELLANASESGCAWEH